MNKTLLHIFFSLLTLPLISQDFKQNLASVMEQQNKLEKQCYSLTYTLRENHNYNSKVLHKSLGKYIKTKTCFLSAIDHIVSLTMPEEVIMIDKEQKKIVVSKTNKKVIAQFEALKQLEDYNKDIAKIVTSEFAKNKFLYSVELKKSPSPISKYEIALDMKTKSIIRLTLFYKGTLPKDDNYKITGKEVPRLDIEFFDYNNFNVLKEDECARAYYVTKNNNKLIPTYNFKGYEVKQL